MSSLCEVVVDRPILRHRVVTGLDPGVGWRQDETSEAFNPLRVTFHYAVPEALRPQVAAGQLVEVPFRTSTLQGIIFALSDVVPPDVDQAGLRPLASILDPIPVLDVAQIELAEWLSARYLAQLGRCAWLFLPPGSRRLPQTVVKAVPEKKPPPDLDARAQALFLYLQSRDEPIPAKDLEAEPLKVLSALQLVQSQQRLAPPGIGPLIDRTVELIATPEEIAAALPSLGRASKQADVLSHLAALDDPLPALEAVLAAVGCSDGPVRSLAKRGWVRLTSGRNLVSTPLSGPAIEGALGDLDRAPVQRAALTSLLEHPGPVETSQLNVASSILGKLEEKGYARRWTEPTSVALSLDSDQVLGAVLELRGATRHAAVLDMLSREEGRVWVGWVYAQTDATLDTLRSLADAKLIALDETRRWRDPLADHPFVLDEPPRLTPDQEKVWDAVQKTMGEREARAFLLQGVTGSGKTEIYLRAAAEALGKGQGAIILVPEIALAAQTVRRVAARFPGQVAVWHSDLSLGQRFDTWQRVRAGELPVVVGARSALFAPVPSLGLVVVDEEHEPAYKGGQSPRYHAREAARQLGQMTGATVILGSATPDVDTYRRAQRGELALLTLPKRVLAHRQHLAVQALSLNASVLRAATRPFDTGFEDLLSLPLPPVEVVDLREELRTGNRSIFSRALQRAIRETLDADQQVLLFLNRRGAATFVLCRDCGHVMRCSRCETPLTFHAEDEALHCHHCNRRQPNPDRCPACQSSRIRYFGLGTERVETVVREMYPDARPLRWDLDTARTRGSHAAFLRQLVEGRANVLIGTQMIAKGLDLPRVTLVGVVSADTALYLPDFRAAERTFQLLAQVAGRAGRSPLGGRVILQTYNPDLPVIRAAAAHDYAAFYEDELSARRESGYPPFKRLARLVFLGSGAERAEREAERLSATLRSRIARHGIPEVDVIGPAPCFYRKLRGQQRWHILIRADEPEGLLRPLPLPLGWRVDVDPVDLL